MYKRQEGHRKDVYLLSTADGAVTVTPFPPLPIALAYTAAAVLGGKVYLTGGCERPGEQDCTNRVFMLDARGPEQGWQELDPPSSMGLFGKLVPPAQIIVSPHVPAYMPAKPSGSGREGKGDQDEE